MTASVNLKTRVKIGFKNAGIWSDIIKPVKAIRELKIKDRRLLIGFAVCLMLFFSGLTIGVGLRMIYEPLPSLAVKTYTTALPLGFKDEDTPPATSVPEPYAPDFTLPVAANGMAPVVARINTKQPVVFLGIDDGAYKDPTVVQLLKDNNVKASLYLSKAFMGGKPEFFKQIVDNGSLVEDHTLDHDTKMTTTQTYEQQRAQICGMADYEEQHYGRRPVFFRPPGGAYSDTMRKAAYDCGMKVIVTWVAKANGGSMQYQIGNGLRAGDIVLMHFRPEFKQDLQAFITAQNAAGLHTELLEDAIVN